MNPLKRWKFVIQIRGLDRVEKAVLNSLAYHAGNESLICWPSLKTIASETGYERTAVRNAIRRLSEKGLLKITSQSTGRVSNKYQLFLTQPVHNATVAECNGSVTHHQPVQKTASTGAQRYPNIEGTKKEQDTPPASSVWNVGEQLLGSRAYVGKLIGEFGETEVASALGQLSVLPEKADPKSYIRGMLASKSKQASKDATNLVDMC